MKPMSAPSTTLYGDNIKTILNNAELSPSELVAALTAFDAKPENVDNRLIQGLENVLLTHALTADEQQVVIDAIDSIRGA